MFLKKKKRILETIDSVCEVVSYAYQSGEINLLDDVETAIGAILNQVEQEEYDMKETVMHIETALVLVDKAKEKKEEVTFDELNAIIEQVSIFEQAFLIQVQVKLNVVFMPYNITMWDSLESIYLACREDEDCVARVVPIPFFDITQNPPVANYHLNQYDESIGAIDFREFDLAAEEPDVIYIHNAYDDGNILTTVHPDYYTENLKKYTDMLVFVPYCIPNFRNDPNAPDAHSFTFDVRGVNRIDRFVSAGNFVKKEGIIRGIPNEKIINLGSPKFDSLIHKIQNDVEIPREWIKAAKGRRVVVFATAINYFILQLTPGLSVETNIANRIGTFMQVLTAFKENDIHVIWRPHPLTREFINKACPIFTEWYDTFCENTKKYVLGDESYITLDEGESYLPAFKFSDALYTDGSSIIYPYLLLNKKLILTGKGEDFKEHKIKVDSNKIAFQHEKTYTGLETIVDFEKTGELEIDNKFLSQYYVNLDGTSGEKIHKAVKNDTLTK